jgi:hypothetical protein
MKKSVFCPNSNNFILKTEIRSNYFYSEIESKNKRDTLSERDESRRVSGTNTRSTVLDRLVGQTELAQVVSDHLSLDFDLVERLAVVHTDDAADHLGDDDGVTQVGLNHGWLLQWRRLFLHLAQLLQQSQCLALKASVVTSASSSRQQLNQFIA